MGDGNEGLILVIKARVQIKTKQMKSFQIGIDYRQTGRQAGEWLEKEQTLKLLIS